MLKTTQGARAHSFEHAVAPKPKPPFRGRVLYAVDQHPGVWRPVPMPSKSEPIPEGVVIAFVADGIMALRLDEELSAELSEAIAVAGGTWAKPQVKPEE